MNEREYVEYEDAVAMLPDGDQIHTLRQGGSGMTFGADWGRENILAVLKAGRPELAGPRATNMNHGLVLYDESGALFIETRRGETQ